MDPIGGGQFKAAVQQIIEAEKQPIKALEARKAKEEARSKLFQEFKSKFMGLEKAISEVSTFRKFRELKVDLGDGAAQVSVTVDKDRAEPGKYQMEIDQLATRTSALSTGLENPDEPILGPGFIALTLENGDTQEIYIDDKDSSLRGIASVINQTKDSPIRASVFKDDADPEASWKLMLVGKQEGVTHQIEFPQLYFLDATSDFRLDDDNEAKNAEIVVDGFTMESQSNDVNDFLPGVNLHLKQSKPDSPFFLTITEDYQKMVGKVKGLVDQLNQILQFITKQNAIDQHTDTTTTLAGDTGLQTIEYKLRNILHGVYSTSEDDPEAPSIFLSQIGIEFEKTGQITFKEEKFTKLIENNFEGISQVITGKFGLSNQLRYLYDSYTKTSKGFLQVKDQGLKARIKEIDDQIDKKTVLLEQKKQSVTNKFARLEATLGNLQRQQQYLAAALPGAGGANPIAQLIGG